MRLTESYTEAILEVLPTPANGLGHGLGIAPHIVSTFTEADLRASVVFQVTRGIDAEVKRLEEDEKKGRGYRGTARRGGLELDGGYRGVLDVVRVEGF